jgi:hypothetical protein
MDLAVRAQWVDADKHLMRNDAPACSCPFHNSRAEEKESLLSRVADEILEIASGRGRAGLRQEAQPALAAATSELASAGLVRVADLELRSKGYEPVQAHDLQAPVGALGPAPNP